MWVPCTSLFGKAPCINPVIINSSYKLNVNGICLPLPSSSSLTDQMMKAWWDGLTVSWSLPSCFFIKSRLNNTAQMVAARSVCGCILNIVLEPMCYMERYNSNIPRPIPSSFTYIYGTNMGTGSCKYLPEARLSLQPRRSLSLRSYL